MLSTYRSLLQCPGAAPRVWASLLGRLPLAVIELPLILVARSVTGSFTFAGATIAAFSAGIAVSAPLRGRAIDRLGSRSAVPPLVVLHSAALVALALLPGSDAHWTIVALAALAGTTAPALPIAMRVEWQRLLGDRNPRLEHAYAFEAVVQWALFVVGPFLAGLGVATIGARGSLVASGALTFTGGLAFAALAGARPGAAASCAHAGRSPIRIAGVRTLVGATVLSDAAIGAVELVIVAFARQRAAASTAGILLGLFCASAVLCGVAYGARSWSRPPPERLVRLMTATTIVLLPLALARSVVALAFLLVAAGAPFAAQAATSSVALDGVAPPGTIAEAYSLLSAANAVGLALGGLAGGAITQAAGTGAAFVAAAGLMAASAAFVWSRRATLARAEHRRLDGDDTVLADA